MNTVVTPKVVIENRIIANIRCSRILSKKYDTLNPTGRRMAVDLIARGSDLESAIGTAKRLTK